MFKFEIFILLILFSSYFAEIIIIPESQTIYDGAGLKIRGSGFDADVHNIMVDLIANKHPVALQLDEDYSITNTSDGINVNLFSGRKWVDLSGLNPPVPLILTGVRFASHRDKNLIPLPMIIAQVIPTPTITANSDIIYESTTKELRISGTGFVGAKYVNLTFSPPLQIGVAYEVRSSFPLLSNEIELILLKGNWRFWPGPLQVTAIDTGGGSHTVSPVAVAVVQADLTRHGVTVEETSSKQYIYHVNSTLNITGSGFNSSGNTLRFISGRGKYKCSSINDTFISTPLRYSYIVISNESYLPGTLTLLAVDVGQGHVAVGSTDAKVGCDVATVFERPQVISSNTYMYRTRSHELCIKGTGFTTTLTSPQLKFLPALHADTDYTMHVFNRTDMKLTLLPRRAWRPDAGPLFITHINTLGNENGWVEPDGFQVGRVLATDQNATNGVQVALVLEDVDLEYVKTSVEDPMIHTREDANANVQDVTHGEEVYFGLDDAIALSIVTVLAVYIVSVYFGSRTI